MITGIASNPQITALSGRAATTTRSASARRTSAMMQALGIYLADKKPFKTVAIVAEDTDFGRGGADAFKAVADKAGVEVVSTDFHPQNAPDFTSILTRLQQRRPDAIATFQLGGDSINFLRQAMQIGVRIPYTGRIELGGRNVPIIEAGGMEKSVSAWQYSPYADSPSNKAFAEKIKAKYKAEPYLQTWAGYDSIRVLAQAIKDANSTDGTKIKDAIKEMSFTNVMGKTVKFDDYNQAGHLVALHTVLNRKVTLADLVEVAHNPGRAPARPPRHRGDGTAYADRCHWPRPDGRQHRASADARRAILRRLRRQSRRRRGAGEGGRHGRLDPGRPGRGAAGAAHRLGDAAGRQDHRGHHRDLAGLMTSGDAIIDGGNTIFKDDVRRARELQPQGHPLSRCRHLGRRVGPAARLLPDDRRRRRTS